MGLNYTDNRGHSAVSRLRKSQAQIAKTEAVANSIKRKVGDDLLVKLSSNPESLLKQAMDLCWRHRVECEQIDEDSHAKVSKLVDEQFNKKEP